MAGSYSIVMLKSFVHRVNDMNHVELYDYDKMHNISYLIENMTVDESYDTYGKKINTKIDFESIMNRYHGTCDDTNACVHNTYNVDTLPNIIKKNPGIDTMYQYMTYGGNCIVFRNTTHVLKICKQPKSTYTEFLDYSRNMTSLPLVRVELVLYADDDYVVYIKKFYEPLSEMTMGTLIAIIETYYTMIRDKIIYQDIYFRNFGVDDCSKNKNDIRIRFFDYHYIPTQYPDEFDITNMILNILYTFGGAHYDKFCNEGFRYEYADYVISNFKIPNVPGCLSEYLMILHNLKEMAGQDDKNRIPVLEKLRSKIDSIKKYRQILTPFE